MVVGILTPRSLVDLVLDEEMDHSDDRGQEFKLGHEKLTVLDCERADTLQRRVFRLTRVRLVTANVGDKSHRGRVVMEPNVRGTLQIVGNREHVVRIVTVVVGRGSMDPIVTG